MKIYNKNRFAQGIILAALGLALLAAGILKGFSVKGSVLAAICLFLGVSAIIRSVSREQARADKLDEWDERNRWIAVKSRSKSFTLTQSISFALMILFIIMGGTSGDKIFIAMSVGLAFALTVSMIAELCTTIYYEHRG